MELKHESITLSSLVRRALNPTCSILICFSREGGGVLAPGFLRSLYRRVQGILRSLIFRSKEKKTGSWSRTNKNSSQTKNRPPEQKRSRTYTLILGFIEKPGSRSRTVLDRIPQTIFPKQNRLPETSSPGAQTQTKSAPGAKWNTNKPKQKGPTKIKYMYEQ